MGRRDDASRSPRRRRPVAADYFSPAEDGSDGHRRTHHRRRSDDAADDDDVDDDNDRRKRRKHRHHHHHHHHRPLAQSLPYEARHLSRKHDLEPFTPLFAYYLDIQKGLDFYSLDSREARGRWKSFVTKWNSGELAEGWYDPEMFQKVAKDGPPVRYAAGDDEDEDEDEDGAERHEATSGSATKQGQDGEDAGGNSYKDNDEDDDYGPPPPPPSGQGMYARSGDRSQGPGIPRLADLAMQREAALEERAARASDLRLARRADRAQQRERLDELVPRAEAGTRERRLEKRALVNDKMRAFRDRGGGGETMAEVGDADLMGDDGGGGGGDSLGEYKRAVAAQQRKKTERELRREAEARALREEREERLREWREREEEKLRGLKELARARFG